METVLVVATILGGIAAIWYFCDKLQTKEDPWAEEEKLINNRAWEKSELKRNLEARGYKFRWSDSDRVEERKSNGYEVIYEHDNKNRKKYFLVNDSNQVLIGKKDT